MAKKATRAVSYSFDAMQDDPPQHTPKPAPAFKAPIRGDSKKPIAVTPFPLSPQQLDVLDWVRNGTGHAFVQARAGSGKTATLKVVCREMFGSVAYAAFNKKIAEEVKYALGDLPGVRVGTFHSFGFGGWRRVAPRVTVNAQQKDRAMMDHVGVPSPLRSAVRRMVSLGKQSVVGLAWQPDNIDFWASMIDHHNVLLAAPATRDEDRLIKDLIEYSVAGLQFARDQGTALIDFDDMLWLPLIEDVSMYQNDWVLVDEAQDTNVARRLLAERMVKRNGRTLWVGDLFQSIYGFTGADADAVQQIIEHFNCAELPLTVSFRCSKAATALAQRFVPDIRAAESNLPGSVTPLSANQMEQWLRDKQFRAGDAILCRNTRPLVDLAFQIIRSGVGCHVEGRDIGMQLGALATRWEVPKVTQMLTKLAEYRIKETERLVARDAEHLIEPLNDRIDTLMILADGCDTVTELCDKIEGLFRDTEAGDSKRLITLSTVHKAKGREWDRVFLLGWGKYMPSKMAKKDWEFEQERNLQYVAVTRTKDALYLTDALS